MLRLLCKIPLSQNHGIESLKRSTFVRTISRCSSIKMACGKVESPLLGMLPSNYSA